MIPRNQAVLHPSLTQVYSGNDLNIILEMFAAFEEYWLSGYMYEFGEGLEIDYAQAQMWYRRAAASGDAAATSVTSAAPTKD